MKHHVKAYWKLILLMLALCQLIFCFSACEKEPQEPEVPVFELTRDQLSAYTIVTPYKADVATTAAATTLQGLIEKAVGVKPEIKKDPPAAVDFTPSEYEILLGLVDREEVRDYYATVKKNDSGYAMVGKKLLIVGYTGGAVSKSVTHFKMKVLEKLEDTGVLLKSGDADIVSGTYSYQTLSINGVDITKYQLIYPQMGNKGEAEIAAYLQSWIEDQTGYVIACADDSSEAGEYEILIGDVSRVPDAMKNQRAADGFGDKKIYLGTDGKTLWLSGNDRISLYRTYTMLLDSVKVSDKTLALDFSASVCHNLSSFKLSVMNYNVYYDLSSNQRNPDDVIVSILQKSPDLFGLNEAGKDWIDKINGILGAEYGAATGKALDNASDASYNPIYYKKSKFDLVESDTRWLSDTPDRMSKFTDAKHYKGLTYAILRDKITGTEFMYINVHLDGSNDGAAHNALKDVRKRQAEVLKTFMEGYHSMPIITGGDFNEGPSSGVIAGMSQGGRSRYCANIAEQKALQGTTNVTADFTSLESHTLDYIFVTSDSISVQKYEEWANKINGKYPSDHIPVYAEISIYY